MEHRNIPYEYEERTIYDGSMRSCYTCKYFNFYPYHVISFSTDTKQEMVDQIDEFVNNRSVYVNKRKLTDAGAASFYANNHNNWTGD